MKPRPRFKLSSLVDVAVLILCVTATYVLIDAYRRNPPAQVAIAPGERISAAVDLQRPSLIMALRSSCGYCTASMPFYRSLVADRTSVPRPFDIVVIGTETAEQLATYVESHGFKPDRIRSLPASEMRGIPGTPMLMLVDVSGVVQTVWRGMVDPEGEVVIRERLGLSAR